MGRDCLPTVAMVLVQLGFAGMNVVSKLALDTGMSPYVLIAYRNLIAAAFLAPVAFYFERTTWMQGELDGDHQKSASPDVLFLHFWRDAEPGTLLRGAQDHKPDRGVRAHQHAPGADLRHGGGVQAGDGADGDARGAGQGGRHGGLRRRFHGHALLQGPSPPALGLAHPLALRRERLRRSRARQRPRRRRRRRPRHRQLRRVGRLVHHPDQDVGEVLGAVHEHDDHVPDGGGAVRGHRRGHRPEPLGVEARFRHQAVLRALHRGRRFGDRVRAHVVVHPGAWPAVRVHVQPADARRRRRRRLGCPRGEDTRRECYRLRADRRRAVHGAVGQGEGDEQTGRSRRRRRRRCDRGNHNNWPRI